MFLYFGVTADEAPAALTFPQELADEASYSNLCTASWNCNYQYALENVMDPMHGTYLHSSSHSMAEGDRKADMGLEPTDSGFIFKKNGQIGVNFDWVEFGSSGAYWMRLSIPYKKRFGPGGHFWIIGMVVPEDKDHCRVFFWRIRKVKDWQRDMWRFMYRNRRNHCIGTCSSRIASCLRTWRLTHAAANTCTSTTLVFRACAA